MKITGYTPGVDSVGGSGKTPRVDNSALAEAYRKDPVDLTPIVKGINDTVKTIDYVHEQQDRTNILAAMDSYNASMNDLLKNEKTGLLNTKEEGAAGIMDVYAQKAQEMQNSVVDNTKLHFRGNKVALENFFNKASMQGMEQVRAHQIRQNEIVQDNHLGNIKKDSYSFASENYNSLDKLNNGAKNLGLAVDLRFDGYGKERLEAERNKAFGEYGSTAAQAAIAFSDFNALGNILTAYGKYMSADQKLKFEKFAEAKQESNFFTSVAKSISSGGGSLADKIARAKSIKTRTVTRYSSSENIKPAKISEGIADTNLSKTNKNLVNGVNMLNTWAEDTFGKGFVITGGARNPEHNQAVNGAKNSWHLSGGALDVDLSMYSEKQKDAILQKAKEMGFNDDGESMYHDKGTGFHAHLIMPKSGQFASTGQAYQTEVALTEEETDKIVQLVIHEENRKRQIQNMANYDLSKSVENAVFQRLQSDPNYTPEMAMSEYADIKNCGSADEYKARRAAIAHVFGVPSASKSTGVGVTRKAKGKGDAMVVYEMQKLIEQHAFENRTELISYLRSNDCQDLTDSQIKKVVELFDDFTEKKGAYKVKWSDFDDQIINGAKMTAAEKEYTLANAHAKALDYIKHDYDPKENAGRLEPTMGQIVTEARKGILNNWEVQWETKEKGMLWGENDVTKTISIPEGALIAAGYNRWEDNGDSTVNLYQPNGEAITIPKTLLLSWFSNAEVK